MRRTWLSMALVASSIFMGAAHLHAQSPRCDAPHTPNVTCKDCSSNSGVYIPSLQFLVVDRLSAAGDRLERSIKSTPSRIPARTCKPKTIAPRREASCGVDIRPAPSRPCDQVAASGKISDRSPNNGSISDFNEKSVAPPVPPAPTSVAQPTPPSRPAEAAPFSPPKLLRTPVSTSNPPAASEQVDEPKLTDIPDAAALPETPQAPSEAPSSPESGALPRVENVPLPTPPEQPLPDILVDPFIEDVGHWRTRGDRGVIQTSATRPVPVNPLRAGGNPPERASEGADHLPTIRTGEPKRLTPRQKSVSESAPAQGDSPRTLVLRSFE